MAGREIDYGDEIDENTFEQILEMDDDEDDRSFSESIFVDFKEQADRTIVKMQALAGLDWREGFKAGEEPEAPEIESDLSEEEKLTQLSHAGHFLKGSSATLGLVKVSAGCEKIQHYGQHKNDSGDPSNDSNAQLMTKIKNTIVRVQKDYISASARLDRFYGL